MRCAALIVAMAIALAGCASRYDDGAGGLWRGVKHVQESRP